MNGLTRKQPIIIKGKLAKEFYKKFLKDDKGMSWHNDGTAKNPILRVEEW